MSRMTPDEWAVAPAFEKEGQLTIGGHDGVVLRKECPTIEAAAKKLVTGPGTILEIGYGLGMSARVFKNLPADQNPHTIIELNHNLAAIAEADGHHVIRGDYRVNMSLAFDFVFCDAYNFEDDRPMSEQFLAVVHRFCHMGTRVAYFDSDDPGYMDRAIERFHEVEEIVDGIYRWIICRRLKPRSR